MQPTKWLCAIPAGSSDRDFTKPYDTPRTASMHVCSTRRVERHQERVPRKYELIQGPKPRNNLLPIRALLTYPKILLSSLFLPPYQLHDRVRNACNAIEVLRLEVTSQNLVEAEGFSRTLAICSTPSIATTLATAVSTRGFAILIAVKVPMRPMLDHCLSCMACDELNLQSRH